MRRFACQTLLALLAGTFLSYGQTGQDPVADAKSLADKVISAKTASGRYMAAGTNRVAVYDFIRWVEDLGERYSRLTGLDFPETSVPLLRARFFGEPVDGSGFAVEVNSRLEAEALTHSVNVAGYSPENVEDLMDIISACLTASIIRDASLRSGTPARDASVPVWLTQGLAQNLYPGQKKRNSETMLKRWKRGRMFTLNEILAKEQGEEDAEALRMGRGVFVSWLLSFGKEKILHQIIEKIALEGGASADDVIQLIIESGEQEPAFGWDRWMLRQSKTVYLPGSTTTQDLNWFKRQLLIHPREFGIQSSEDLAEEIELEDLIDLKHHEGVRSALKSLSVEMQLKAAGQSEEFHKVIDSYCDYFAGILDKKMDWRLKRSLRKAEKQLRDFEIRTLSKRLKEKDAGTVKSFMKSHESIMRESAVGE